MRLKSNEIEALKEAACSAFGQSACVRLYGSRVHDSLRGGDIDIIIESDPVDDKRRAEAAFLAHLFRRIDEQKVDIVYAERGKPLSAFARYVLPDSVPLS